MASRGIVIFGINNSRVDYIRLAAVAGAYARRHMGVDLCLITDAHSKGYYDSAFGKSLPLDSIFKHIKLVDAGSEFVNKRTYRDTRYYHFEDTFRNEGRSLAYALSPFEETLLLDCDYLVLSDVLNNVWGSEQEVMMNRSANGLLHQPLTGDEFWLNPFGVRMYWATVIYFKKGPKAKLLFELVEHVKENWEYYTMLYELPGRLFRNDYAFSIAVHVLNGFVDSDETAAPLPDPTILTATDYDQLYRVNGPDDLSFFANDNQDTWKFYATRLRGVNVHCMNKLSIINNADALLRALK